MSKVTVWTNGCFDGGILPHHVSFLEKCKQYGTLVVGLNTDASVRSLKGMTRPIIPYEQRRECLEALSCVDLVVPLAEKEPSAWIKMLKPDYVIKGYPQGKQGTWTRDNMPEWSVCDKLRIEVVFLEGPAGISTTEVIERIKNG
jgi:rfaE bifunctional protein nucleotidyltransferase chain/domain